MSSPKKSKILFFVGITAILIAFLRISHLDHFLFHSFSSTELNPEFPKLNELKEVQEWIDLKNENPKEAFSQLEMLQEQDRYEELSTVIQFVNHETKDLLIAKYFTVSSGEINILPHPEIRWLSAEDLWEFIENRGIGISRDEPDGQLFYIYGATLFRKGQSEKFLSLVEQSSPLLAQNLLEVLHFAVVTAPENYTFTKAYHKAINRFEVANIFIYLENIAQKSNPTEEVKNVLASLPKNEQNILKSRFRRELGYFLVHQNLN